MFVEKRIFCIFQICKCFLLRISKISRLTVLKKKHIIKLGKGGKLYVEEVNEVFNTIKFGSLDVCRSSG